MSTTIYNQWVDRFEQVHHPKFFPSVALKITTNCRMKCPFCCEPPNARRQIAAGEWLVIVESFLARGTCRFCLTGGEPVLYKHIPAVLHYIKSAGAFSVLSVADGELFCRRYNELESDLQFIRFSIHGPEYIHDNTLGRPGSYRQILHAVRMISGKNPFSVSFVVNRLNLQYLIQTATLARDIGAAKFSVYSILESGYGQSFIKAGYACFPEDVEDVVCRCHSKLGNSEMVVSYYQYNLPGECVLVHDSGEIYLDPWPGSPNTQYRLGNIRDDAAELWRAFRALHSEHAYFEHIQQ